jgi:hypothetical protein
VETVIDPRYKDLTCYNCGEPGNFVGIYDKAKVCFICAILGTIWQNVQSGRSLNWLQPIVVVQEMDLVSFTFSCLKTRLQGGLISRTVEWL